MIAPSLSIVTTCKGRLAHLRRTLPAMVSQRESEVIVVDYDCPDGTGNWVRMNFPAVRVAVVTDAPEFNVSHARNVGAEFATAPWIAFCDADQFLSASFAAEALCRLGPGAYLRTLRDTPWGPKRQGCPVVCERASFHAVGRYDDAFHGWGAEDWEFIDRLDRCGLREVLGEPALVATLTHSNEMRYSWYANAIDVSMVVNHHYARIKQRYFETRQQWFSDEQRHATYRQVDESVRASLADPRAEMTFDIQIPGAVPPWTARLTAAAVREFHRVRNEALSRVVL